MVEEMTLVTDGKTVRDLQWLFKHHPGKAQQLSEWYVEMTSKTIKPGLAWDGSTLIVCRLGDPWDRRRYLTQEEMKLKKSDFPEDTVFMIGGKMTEIKVTEAHIDYIMEKTDFSDLVAVHGKTTIVIAKLPNGFVIVESSSCVDPANYNHDLGVKLCKERIRDKIWMLEGYMLQVMGRKINELFDNMELAKNNLIDNVKLANP